MKYIYRGEDKRKQGLSVELDIDTQLWLARMVAGEGGKRCGVDKASALLWAILNRYMLHPATGRIVAKAKKLNIIDNNDNPFIGMIRLFSQPINPRWARGGDLAIRYAGTKFATEDKFRRRKYFTEVTWKDVPTNIKRCVTYFANGALFVPECLTSLEKPRISDWASLSSTPTKYPWGVDIEGDWFFENKGLVKGEVIVRL